MKKIKQLWLGLVCRFKGHKYGASEFNTWSLCYCRRCGEEMAGRTFADLETPPNDADWFDNYIGNE